MIDILHLTQFVHSILAIIDILKGMRCSKVNENVFFNLCEIDLYFCFHQRERGERERKWLLEISNIITSKKLH